MVSVRLDEWMVAHLEQTAAECGVTKSRLVAEALSLGLDPARKHLLAKVAERSA